MERADVTNALFGLDEADVSVTLLPDGSVDRRFEVEGREGAVRSRESFGRRIAEGDAKSFYVDHRTTDPGGQAVNAARQHHAFGDDVLLVGHLDHDIFETLDVDAYSMGVPAVVQIYEFEDDAVMLTEESSGIENWRFDALERALGDGLDAALTRDAVVWMNWASFPHGTAALRALRDRDPDGDLLVVDPGDVTVSDPAEVPAFFDVLSALSACYDVVVSANRPECRFLADALLDTVPETDDALVRELGDAGDLHGAVLHEVQRAVAATGDGTVSVPNVDTENATRYMGGGDRFTAGLAHALAAGRPWADALALGNACASYYVLVGETAAPEDIRAFVTGD